MVAHRRESLRRPQSSQPKKKGMGWQGWAIFFALIGSGVFCGFSWGRATASPSIDVPAGGAPYALTTINGEEYAVLTTEQYGSLLKAADSAEVYEAALSSAFRSAVIPVTATAYNATRAQCGNGKGITATGTKVRQGRTIAVSRKLFPHLKGKRVALFDGGKVLGVYMVEDKMHERMRGNRVDVYLERLDHAEEFGVRKLHLVVLEA